MGRRSCGVSGVSGVWRSETSAATIASSVLAHAEECCSKIDALGLPRLKNTSPGTTCRRQLAARFRCGRRNERSIEVLPGFETVVESRPALESTKAGKCGEGQAIAERVMGERLLGLAATDGSCTTSRAIAGRAAAESAAAARVAVRFVEEFSAARKPGRSSESIEGELANEASRGFLRARSHWASRACTSASTHSSKISLNSLRRLATVFRRLRWKDSMEASDEVKRYSRGRSMASSRDAEGCFASPLELGIDPIDITRVITSYSTGVAVPLR
jgi:hypothetical protein